VVASRDRSYLRSNCLCRNCSRSRPSPDCRLSRVLAKKDPATSPAEDFTVVSEDSSPVIAAWDVPSWATCTEVDEQAVIYTHVAGNIVGREGGALLTVLLIQRDELNATSDSCTINRGPVDVMIDGIRLSQVEALRMSDMIHLVVSRATR